GDVPRDVDGAAHRGDVAGTRRPRPDDAGDHARLVVPGRRGPRPPRARRRPRRARRGGLSAASSDPFWAGSLPPVVTDPAQIAEWQESRPEPIDAVCQRAHLSPDVSEPALT